MTERTLVPTFCDTLRKNSSEALESLGQIKNGNVMVIHGGGAMVGMYLGILRGMLGEGFEFDAIVGNSAGALAAGIVNCATSNE